MKVENISKSFGEKNLFADLSIVFSTGLLFIKGESGSGKSTLLSCLAGTLKPDKGNISYGGFSFSGKRQNELSTFRRKNISYLAQTSVLIPSLSLRSNMKSFFGHKSVKDEKYAVLKNRLLFNKDYMPYYKMSGGEKKKAELIFCLYKDASVFLLDEPFSSLDSNAKTQLIKILEELALDKIVILVSHNVELKDFHADLTIDFDSIKKQYKTSEKDQSILKPGLRSPQRRMLTWQTISAGFNMHPAISIFRIAVILCIFFSFFLSLAALPRSSESTNQMLWENDPYQYLCLRTPFYADDKPNLDIGDKVSTTDDVRVGILTDDLFFYTDNSIPDDVLSFSSSDVPLQIENEKCTLRNIFDGSTKYLSIRISLDTSDEMPYYISKYTIENQLVTAFLSGRTLNSIFLAGGLASLTGSNGLPYSSKMYIAYNADINYSYELLRFAKEESFDKNSSISYSPLVIENRSDYYISVPGVLSGTPILNSDMSYGTTNYLPACEESQDGKVHLSLTSFYSFASASSQSKLINKESQDTSISNTGMIVGIFAKKNSCTYLENHYNVFPDSAFPYVDDAIISLLMILSWSFFGVLSVLLAMLDIFSSKGEKNWHKRFMEALINSGVDTKSVLINSSVSDFIIAEFSALIGFVIYLFVFIFRINLAILSDSAKYNGFTLNLETPFLYLGGKYSLIRGPLPYSSINLLALLSLVLIMAITFLSTLSNKMLLRNHAIVKFVSVKSKL